MEQDKKKDALTDLVDVAVSVGDSSLDKPLNDGEAITPSGEVVTMDFTALAKKLLKLAREKIALRSIVRSQLVEKHLKQPPRKDGQS